MMSLVTRCSKLRRMMPQAIPIMPKMVSNRHAGAIARGAVACSTTTRMSWKNRQGIRRQAAYRDRGNDCIGMPRIICWTTRGTNDRGSRKLVQASS